MKGGEGDVAMKTIVLKTEGRGQAHGPKGSAALTQVQPWFSTLNVMGGKMFLESLDLAAASRCF